MSYIMREMFVSTIMLKSSNIENIIIFDPISKSELTSIIIIHQERKLLNGNLFIHLFTIN